MTWARRPPLPLLLLSVLLLAGNPGRAAAVGTPVGERCAACRLEAGAGLSAASLGVVPAPATYVQGRKRLLILRVDFPDFPGEVWSAEAAANLVAGVGRAYAEMSYGRTTIAPVGLGSAVSPVLRLPQPSTNYLQLGPLRAAARAAAAAAGLDLAQFDFDLVCTGDRPEVTFAGTAFTGSPGAWLARGTFRVEAAVHELGHNLGLPHAGSWNAGPLSVIGPGVAEEYGDPYDPMGLAVGNEQQFNARAKALLGWIPPEDAPRAFVSGTWRLMAHDEPRANGLRALWLAQDSARQYWLEFRSRLPAGAARFPGLQLRWASTNNAGTLLLDSTPGSAHGTNDAALALGRTYSDPAAGIHITPVARTRTFPESIDVVVNLGSFPANRPPTLALHPSSPTVVATGAVVRLDAAAADPDGDALAFHWDFGDGDAGTNGPAASHAWLRPGEYVARCTVSDRKGGTCSDSVLVQVGTVATYRIAGRVLAGPEPLAGVHITAGESAATLTDGDGTFVLTGLAAGTHVVTARREGYECVPAGFTNPVSVGPNATAIDFFARPAGSPTNAPLLVAPGSVWRFHDLGGLTGTAWTARDYHDAAWRAGPGQLGYGDNDEVTVVGFGPDAVNKFITTYFRHAWLVPQPGLYTNLTLGLLRDDAAVVYLNGTEVLRDNLPSGSITSMTLALLGSEGNFVITTNVDPALLVPGTNVLAVEVHQSSVTSSDLSFDLFLSGLGPTDVDRQPFVYVAAPENNARFVGPTNLIVSTRAHLNVGGFISGELLINGLRVAGNSNATLSFIWQAPLGTHELRVRAVDDLGAEILSPPTRVEILPPSPPTDAVTFLTPPENARIPPGDPVLIEAVADGVARVDFLAGTTVIGSAPAPPYRVAWSNPPAGPHQLTAVGTTAGGAQVVSAPRRIEIAPPPRAEELLAPGAVWSYHDGPGAPAAWREPGFDDRTWPRGYAPLGYGNDDESTSLRFGPDPEHKHLTAWFRRSFVADAIDLAALRLRLVVDDGAVVYLNGVELWRTNLSSGTIDPTSLALVAVGGEAESAWNEAIVPSDRLQTGTNVVAVEVHQAFANSTDLRFDLALDGLRPADPTVLLQLASPANGSRVRVGAPVVVRAHVGLAREQVQQVEFFAGLQSLGTGRGWPPELTWSQGAAGTFDLNAVALLSAGGSLTSAPVAVHRETAPDRVAPFATALVVRGSVWRYRDDGTDPGPGWREPDYADASWPSGPARLGYGWDGEATRLEAGATTTYFRQWFQVENPAVFQSLHLLLLRDDGAAVHLNGREVYRSNLPDGPLTASVPALAAVTGFEEQQYFTAELPVTGLLDGWNLLAVEVHQDATGETDHGFDLELVGEGSFAGRALLGRPLPGQHIVLPATVPLEAFAWPPLGGAIVRVDLLLDGTVAATVAEPPYRWTWTAPSVGAHELRARAHDNFGRTYESAPTTITVGFPTRQQALIPAGAVWRYLDDGSALGPEWSAPGFPDTAWPSGPARLGYGGDGEATTLRGGPGETRRFITTYFRHWLTNDSGAVLTNLVAQLIRDDGAVVYLNGQELFRSNMPDIAVTPFTLATTGVGGADEQAWFETVIPIAPLPAGPNVVAIEVHQSAVSSSDLGFALALSAQGYDDRASPPALVVDRAAGQVRARWPAHAVGWRLHESTRAQGPWTELEMGPTQAGDWHEVRWLPTDARRFLRLQKPSTP